MSSVISVIEIVEYGIVIEKFQKQITVNRQNYLWYYMYYMFMTSMIQLGKRDF